MAIDVKEEDLANSHMVHHIWRIALNEYVCTGYFIPVFHYLFRSVYFNESLRDATNDCNKAKRKYKLIVLHVCNQH